jgi:hypothetical protein
MSLAEVDPEGRSLIDEMFTDKVEFIKLLKELKRVTHKDYSGCY